MVLYLNLPSNILKMRAGIISSVFFPQISTAYSFFFIGSKFVYSFVLRNLHYLQLSFTASTLFTFIYIIYLIHSTCIHAFPWYFIAWFQQYLYAKSIHSKFLQHRVIKKRQRMTYFKTNKFVRVKGVTVLFNPKFSYSHAVRIPLSLSQCCLSVPGLSKHIWCCKRFQALFPLVGNHHISHKTNQKWAVSFVIAYGHFNPNGFVRVCMG